MRCGPRCRDNVAEVLSPAMMIRLVAGLLAASVAVVDALATLPKLHLPGENGLLSMLKQQGYTLTRLEYGM